MYEIHPAALLSPAMTDDEYRELVSSIERSGLLVPIELYEGKVIDGRHRLKACEELGVDPETIDIELSDDTTPVLYVCDLHQRRNLSTAQRAAMAAIREEELVKIGKAKRQQNLKQGDEVPEVTNSSFRENTGKSRKIAAEAAGVSENSVQVAAKIKKESPELFEEVKDGKKSLNKAAMELKERKAQEEPCKPKPPKCGAEKVSCHALVDETKQWIGKLVRQFDAIARINGGQGENYKRAKGAMDTVIHSLKQMRKGER